MKIAKIGKSMAIYAVETEPLGLSIPVEFDGVEDGTTVTVYKHGDRSTAVEYIVRNGRIDIQTEKEKYALSVDGITVRFLVYEEDGKRYLKKKKDDAEKAIEQMQTIVLELFRIVKTYDEKIKNISGYRTE